MKKIDKARLEQLMGISIQNDLPLVVLSVDECNQTNTCQFFNERDAVKHARKLVRDLDYRSARLIEVSTGEVIRAVFPG